METTDIFFIRTFMDEYKLSLKEFSDLIGVSFRTVQGWFAGRPCPVWVDKFIKLYQDKNISCSAQKAEQERIYRLLTLKTNDQINYYLNNNDISAAIVIFKFWHSLTAENDFYSIFDFNKFSQKIFSSPGIESFCRASHI